MRFFLSVMGDENYEAGKLPPAKAMEEMAVFLDRAMAASVITSAAGLLPTSTGARLRARNGEIAILDGPFSEAKEVIGGYAFIEATSREEAIRIAREFIETHFRGGIMDVDVELRQVGGGPKID